jgi:hypothetical protein
VTPERRARAAITAAVCAHREDDADVIACAAVERISAAGLIVTTAARAAALLAERDEARRLLRLALPHLVESAESLIQSNSTSYAWQSGEPLPENCEPEALLSVADMEPIIAAIRAMGADA